jgi:virginiamycin B lyase
VGTVIGTPGYAPPEQYQGLATPQSDVYALGATLHRLITGYDPEHGAPFTFPPICDRNPAVSPLLAAAIERAVALNPADRYATAGEFGEELGKLRPRLVPSGARGRACGAARGRVGAWVAAALLLFPLVLSQAFRSTGATMPLSIDQAPLATSGGPFIGAQDVGTPCTQTDVPAQPSSTVTCGPDGSIWFIDPTTDGRIDRVDGEGGVTSYSVPAQYGTIVSMAAGSFACQCIWLAGSSGTLLKMDTFAGSMTILPLPAGRLDQILSAPDPGGNIWVALQGQPNLLVRVGPDGSMQSLALPDGTAPTAISEGSDGNLWFTDDRSQHGQTYDYIGRISPAGALKEWRIPTPGSAPKGIAPGPDGNLWFTEQLGNAIGRITTDGQITEFPLPNTGSQPAGIVAAPDGGMWFSETGRDQIGRIPVYGASASTIAGFPLPPGSRPLSVAYSPDGVIWWIGEGAGARVGSLSLDGTVQILDTSTAMEYQLGSPQQ